MHRYCPKAHGVSVGGRPWLGRMKRYASVGALVTACAFALACGVPANGGAASADGTVKAATAPAADTSPGASVGVAENTGKLPAEGAVETASTAAAETPSVASAVADAKGGSTPEVGGLGDQTPSSDKEDQDKVKLVETAGQAALDPPDSRATEQVAGAVNKFGLNILASAAKRFPKENAVVSPVSLGVAFAMLAQGAAGATRAELNTALGLGAEANAPLQVGHLVQELVRDQADVQFKIANSLWAAKGLLVVPAYADAIRGDFSGVVLPVDFASESALGTVNGWFNENTGGLIPKMLDRLEPATQFLLANALHFKGSWREAFDPADTAKAPFHGAEGVVDVPTMHRTFAKMPHLKTDSADAVRMPFGIGAYELVIVLPVAGIDAATILEAPIADAPWFKSGSWTESEVDLYMPRMQLSVGGDIKDSLIAAGIKAIWGDADLSGISAQPLSVSKVVHRVALTVDEAGAEAAAATAIVGVRSMQAAPPKVLFRVDRPFVLLLRHVPSNALVIAGLIRQP